MIVAAGVEVEPAEIATAAATATERTTSEIPTAAAEFLVQQLQAFFWKI
jgi:hypothetical protein